MLNGFPKHAELVLEGKSVGLVDINRCADSWLFGSFQPNRAFSQFATLFGEWSLLLHADEAESEVSRTALDELAKLERVIDSLHAELLLPDSGGRVPVDQVNIDGELVELKLSEQPPMQ